MPTSDTAEDLVRHLTRVSRLDAGEATRVLAEIRAYFGESVEAFVNRRHGELRAEGLANIDIYRHITEEMEYRRFPAPGLSQRQIRRLIYG